MPRLAFNDIVKHSVAAIPAIARLIQQRDTLLEEVARLTEQLQAVNAGSGPPPVAQSSILETYCHEVPAHQNSFDLFKNEWSSSVPSFDTGGIPLFQDHRIDWLDSKCGGFRNKRILELGPMEAGHTFMMAKRGAAHITSVEGNSRAFMKCLIVKEALSFSADFLLGDFCQYVKTCRSHFDFALASGVLYHMIAPVDLLENLATITDSIGLWTHYFDGNIISANPTLRAKFDFQPAIHCFRGRTIAHYQQRYMSALNWTGFCGGSAPTSHWLTKDGILRVLDALNFVVEITMDEPNHPNGPSMLLFANR